MDHKRVVLIGLIYVALSVTGHPVTAAADGTSALATDKDDTIPVPPLDEVIREHLSRSAAAAQRYSTEFPTVRSPV